jgi:hypothetical protein
MGLSNRFRTVPLVVISTISSGSTLPNPLTKKRCPVPRLRDRPALSTGGRLGSEGYTFTSVPVGVISAKDDKFPCDSGRATKRLPETGSNAMEVGRLKPKAPRSIERCRTKIGADCANTPGVRIIRTVGKTKLILTSHETRDFVKLLTKLAPLVKDACLHYRGAVTAYIANEPDVSNC